MKDNKKNIVIVFVVSLMLVGIWTSLYFFDTSLEWGLEKIISCIITNLWLFFIPSAFRYGLLLFKYKSLEQSFKLGLILGILGIIVLILISPFFGIKYYFIQKKL